MQPDDASDSHQVRVAPSRVTSRMRPTNAADGAAIVDLEDSSYRSTMAWKKDLPGPRVGFFASARRDAERGEARKVAGGGRPGGQRGRFE